MRRVIDDVNFSTVPGEFICLVGPNGAGKSTLLRAVAGVQALRSGSIHFRQDDLSKMEHVKRAQHVSWLPQSRRTAWNMRVEDVVALGRFVQYATPYNRLTPNQRDTIDEAMSLTGADTLKSRQINNLSGGEQARVHLARALASPAESLLLDEPCSALDISHQLGLMSLLVGQAARGRLVIAAMHDLTLAERFASRIIVMHKGRIYADGSPHTALSVECLAEVFAVRRGPERGFLPKH
ncbi:UNVERIFIED_CONTAM: hypothetical protein GTU68_053434 [Idotea baltica]|nr:hypothetical protein [Idotea baltica]